MEFYVRKSVQTVSITFTPGDWTLECDVHAVDNLNTALTLSQLAEVASGHHFRTRD